MDEKEKKYQILKYFISIQFVYHISCTIIILVLIILQKTDIELWNIVVFAFLIAGIVSIIVSFIILSIYFFRGLKKDKRIGELNDEINKLKKENYELNEYKENSQSVKNIDDILRRKQAELSEVEQNIDKKSYEILSAFKAVKNEIDNFNRELKRMAEENKNIGKNKRT